MIVAHNPGADPAATGPDGLWPAERLLLTGIRVWGRLRVEGRCPHETVRAGLELVASPRSAALFVAFMDRYERACLKPLEVHCPCCPGYSADEQRLVLACGVGPVAGDIARRLLQPLVSDAAPLLAIGRSLNASLAADGLELPVRLADEPAEREARVLH
ncbi:MAG: hypothetical protein IT546_12840 [Caulobacteraceae bacterium]|nr:hypothetical protein [Caulobacteraceae bacterium]